MIWTWWMRSSALRNFLWNLTHLPVINLDPDGSQAQPPAVMCGEDAGCCSAWATNSYLFPLFLLVAASSSDWAHALLSPRQLPESGCQQVVTADRLDFGSCSPWCWSCCFPFSEGIFRFMYVNLNMQAVCYKAQCTSFHLPQRPTRGCISRRSNVWWLLLHCLRLHCQDLGLPWENGGNPFALARVAGLFKTSLKCQRMYL